MSIPNLPVNFKDDILAATNPKRKYNLIQNDDGTVSFEDATEYQQTGSDFGAGQINATNDAINKIYSERILSLEEVALVTEPGFFVDAMVVSELIDNIKKQNILWQGAYFMNETQTINLSQKISDQKTGISLVFSFYEGNTAQNWGWVHFFVPKEFINQSNGAGSQFSMFWNSWSHKYLYIYNDHITGSDNNDVSPNNRFVLRYVIGV